ncbi:cytochrome P450 [Streptomyces beijiangensis]|uniref:Cytochrome P450 n=1 Tax=Streptomyces beijiangensis TaxID=163361 RepID=A0A939JEC4_9ACTN|nr:cytochrome P450 [Streptomyces beijiangensis]MBO0511188.1 cytochrome P450 [Streptomyces beijiangensis]
MTTPQHPEDFLRFMRMRSAKEDGIFWVDDTRLGVFEPEAARRVSAKNWHRFVMHDRLIDMVRRRPSAEVRWSQIRSAWLTQLHTLATAEHHGRLIERMERIIDARLGDDVDLVMLTQDVALRSMLPVALSGLTAGEEDLVRRDLEMKLLRLISPDPGSTWYHLRFIAVQLRSGLVVRRVLRQRARGKRTRELDLADPFVDLLPQLGMDRALDVVTAVLTAIGGPPGTAAASLLYEFARHPEWQKQLADELCAVDPVEFRTSPTSAAPVTHRFVKEVLRLWSPPLLLVRRSKFGFDLGGTRLDPGQWYLLSPHLIHRDERVWKQPDVFDPDRFLPGAPHGPADRTCYVPFGWAPKKCVGANIGTVQLMALCHLLCTRYRLTVDRPEKLTMALRFAPVPENFRGSLAVR